MEALNNNGLVNPCGCIRVVFYLNVAPICSPDVWKT